MKHQLNHRIDIKKGFNEEEKTVDTFVAVWLLKYSEEQEGECRQMCLIINTLRELTKPNLSSKSRYLG